MKDDGKTRKGPPKRDATCYRTEYDITIPAGTILRNTEKGIFAAEIGAAPIGVRCLFSLDMSEAYQGAGPMFKKIISA